MDKLTARWGRREGEMSKNGKAKQDGAERVEQLATRITRGSHRALQYLALDRETTVQALVQEALDTLLAKSPRAPKGA
jgi:hypothetical protein